MKQIIDNATRRAIWFNADGATQQFYDYLKDGQFKGTRCLACRHIPFPPRPFCPTCGSDVEWIDLPRQGTLHAWSTQARSLRFFAPDVLGLVELPGVGLVFSKIAGKLEALTIGLPVEVDFIKIDDKLTTHQFKPLT